MSGITLPIIAGEELILRMAAAVGALREVTELLGMTIPSEPSLDEPTDHAEWVIWSIEDLPDEEKRGLIAQHRRQRAERDEMR